MGSFICTVPPFANALLLSYISLSSELTLFFNGWRDFFYTVGVILYGWRDFITVGVTFLNG